MQFFGDEDEYLQEKHKINIINILKQNATETYDGDRDPKQFRKSYAPLPTNHLLDKMKYLYDPYNKKLDLSQGNDISQEQLLSMDKKIWNLIEVMRNESAQPQLKNSINMIIDPLGLRGKQKKKKNRTPKEKIKEPLNIDIEQNR